MQQRQLRLGDILDDYCPRERRVTNHAVVALVGQDVKQTRCTTCDTEHEYKHAKVPRQRKKDDTPAALYAQVAADAPKRVAHHTEPASTAADDQHNNRAADDDGEPPQPVPAQSPQPPVPVPVAAATEPDADGDSGDPGDNIGNVQDEGPAHRRLIRASLPRPEGQQPPQRPIPEFTIRQPAGRQNRFRPRHGGGGGGGQQFGGNRSGGNMSGGGQMRGPGGRDGGRRHGPQGGGGRKRSR